MLKFNVKPKHIIYYVLGKNLAIFILLGVFLFGITGITNAQQVLPKGGDSFETAVKIEPGSYQGGSLKKAEYFYITGVKLGQEISIKGTFIAANVNIGAWAILALYDEDGTVLAGDEEGFYEEPLSLTISSLHKGEESDKYYIMVECDTFEISSYSLDILLKGEGEEDMPSAGGDVVFTDTEKDEEPTEKGLNWLWIVGIIAAIVIIAIVVYLLLKKKK